MRRICWTIPFFAFGAALASDPACVRACADEYAGATRGCDAEYQVRVQAISIEHERCVAGCGESGRNRCTVACEIARKREMFVARDERRVCYREAGSSAARCIRDCSASESRP